MSPQTRLLPSAILALLGGSHLTSAVPSDRATHAKGSTADSAARSVIAAALARLGGEAHVRQQRKWFVAGTGEENLSAELQGITPDRPTLRPHEEWLGVDAERRAVAWERRTPRNDSSLRWRRFVYRDDSSGVIVWTDSVGRMNPGAGSETRRRALMRRIPQLLLLEAALGESLQLGALGSVGGRPHREVRVRIESDTWLSMWISSDSSLLHSAEYRTQLPGRGEVSVQWQWPDWIRGSRGNLRPSGHRIVIDGRLYQRVDYQRFEAASDAADSLLSVPNELRARGSMMMHQAVSSSDSLPVSGQVAPGVHVLDVAGFNVFVVEFAGFIVLVEAPAAAPGFEALPATRAGDRIGTDLAARVREISRGRSLGYTVLTHHHSDHVGNVPALAKLTGAFLVPSDATRLVETAIARSAGASHRKPRVEPVVRTRTIRDSTQTLVIYDVASNPHSQHNLFVWLPRERIGFQGDLFYYDQGTAAPPADRRIVSVFFARWLEQRGILPRAVYGVHSMGATGPKILSDVRQ